MQNIASESKEALLKFIKSSWAFLGGVIGAVITINNFVQLWRGDQASVRYVTGFIGVVLIAGVLGWFGFRLKKDFIYDVRGQLKNIYSPYYPRVYRGSRIGLGVLLLCSVAGGVLLYRQQQALKAEIAQVVQSQNGIDMLEYTRGSAYFETGEFDKAIAFYSELIEKNPKKLFKKSGIG